MGDPKEGGRCLKIVELPEVDSTNSWLASRAGGLEDMTLVRGIRQTAGRGQRGNRWEAEPGKNLSVSLLFRPGGDLHPRSQFSISEATALSVVDTLSDYGISALVKWPNDIYVGERKICGILIEHSLLGSRIEYSVCGLGLNVNQREFHSDAPNPVSMVQLSGEEYPLPEVMSRLGEHWVSNLLRTADGKGREALHERFLGEMWRRDGCYHPFRDTRSGEEFEGRISGVAPEGFLRVETRDGEIRDYAFKEVSFL